ncbi:aldo/keto reductase [bacterium]|nr:aldo/keto reductase [bacterium]
MRYRFLSDGRTEVSEVGFGVWSVATTWWGVKDPQEGIRLLREAHAAGVTFFDTADIYGNGLGETILADAFWKAGMPRDRLVVATKFGYDIYTHGAERSGHGELPQDFSPAFIRHACEESLRRLGTDYIDIYQLHNPRMESIRSDDVLEALTKLKAQGKIRLGGAALGPDIGWRDEGFESLDREGVDAIQIIYSLLEQDPSSAFFPIAEQKNRNLIVRVPHASGLLDRSYSPKKHFDKSDHRSHRKEKWMEAGMGAVQKLEFLETSAPLPRSLAQAAIQFCLAQSSVKTVLPNFTRTDQIREFCAASDLPALPPDALIQIQKLWNDGMREDLAQPFSDSRTKPTPSAPAATGRAG